MDHLTIDIDSLTPQQIAELLTIVQDMRDAQHSTVPLAQEVQEWDEKVHSLNWGRGAQGTPEQEEAYEIFASVVDHGRQLGRDWAPLLIALARLDGEKMGRDQARQLVITDPAKAVDALRGMKQAFARACTASKHWNVTETYEPWYADPYSGVTEISLGRTFSRELLAVLVID